MWQNMMTESSKDKFDRESTEENLRLMRESLDCNKRSFESEEKANKTARTSMWIAAISLIVAIIALFK